MKRIVTPEYIRGVMSLVAMVMSTISLNAMDYLWCLCFECKKDRQFSMLEVHVRLLIRGFMPKFTCHVFLGKEEESEGSADNNDVPTENVGCE